MKNANLLFSKGEAPLRFQFIPYAEGTIKMDGNVINSPETLLLVDILFFDSKKTLGLNKKQFDEIKQLDKDGIVPISIFFNKLIQECIRDLEKQDKKPSEQTLSKYSEEFVKIIDDAIEKFSTLEFN